MKRIMFNRIMTGGDGGGGGGGVHNCSLGWFFGNN